MSDGLNHPGVAKLLAKMRAEGATTEQMISALVSAAATQVSQNKLEAYKPWPKQVEFHALGRTHTECALFAINQCMTPNSVIETAAGERRISELIGAGEFGVRAWDGESLRAADTSPVFLRGIEPAFRIHLDSGQAFECSCRHSVLTRGGYSRIDRLVQSSSGLHCWKTAEGWMANCDTDKSRYGRGLLSALGIGQGLPPSRADALEYIRLLERMDEVERTLQRNHAYRGDGHLTIADDDPMLLSGLCETFQCQERSIDAVSLTNDIRMLWRSLQSSFLDEPLKKAFRGQSLSDVRLGEFFVPLESMFLSGSSQIVAVESIGYKPIVDFEVRGLHNYRCGGVIHHNCGKSYAAAAETAMHLTGKYPANWPGRRFEERTVGWVVSEDWSFSKNNAQRLLMGETREEWGTGLIPKADILDYSTFPHAAADTLEQVIVKNQFGGKSRLLFKSADVERNKLGGDTIHFAWIDEECKPGHYEEILTRVGVKKGYVFTTFTPLKGATDVCNRFLRDKVAGSAYVVWTIDDDNLYSPEQREAKKQQYANSPQKNARLYAIPQQGSGNVFSLPFDQISVTPFTIPDHWPRICGHDIGWTHPASLNWWAFDRDSGTSYLTHTWRAENAKPPVIYDTWSNFGGNRAGLWIPVAWPADGDNETAAGAGVAYIQTLRDLGVFALGEPAMLPETNAEGEKLQGRKSVEAQVQMMDGEMISGKLKVFANCEPFKEEYGLYHRNENGQIVKKLDDTISGARYGWVMKRYARTRNESVDLYTSLRDAKQNWRT